MIANLYDNFKHWSRSGSVYLISDPHFNDEKSLLMNPNWMPAEQYLDILNKTVYKSDTLICLGDCGDITYFPKLKAGYKVLIKGNHDDKGYSYYQRKEEILYFDKLEYTQSSLRQKLTNEYPNYKFNIADGNKFQRGDKWVAFVDNNLFDEVYSGALFISDQILLSHEPINGLTFCANIHGHCHNGIYDYTDNLGGRHLNIAADVIQWQPVDLGKLIKAGLISKLPTIHRLVIDKGESK